jgi:LAO/AO transport system kinase
MSSRVSSSLSAPTAALLHALLSGGPSSRPALARAITLVESSRPEHGAQAAALLDGLLAARARARASALAGAGAGGGGVDAAWPRAPLPPPPPAPRSLRIGVAGAPGAGKSSLIEALGSYICGGDGPGLRVAVLAVDPSSAVGGGAILGDATRMPRLLRCANAFVRASASRGALGGVGRASDRADAVLLCEGAGYDVVLLETVGLGQSEVAIDAAVDMTLLVLAPGGGDELQGAKKGIVEVADALVVTKCDGAAGAAAAARTAAEYGGALGLVRPKHAASAAPSRAAAAAARLPWRPPVLRVSSVDAAAGDGIAGLWRACEDFWRRLGGAGVLAARRRAQARKQAHAALEARLVDAARASAAVAAAAARLDRALEDGELAPRKAGELLLRAFEAELATSSAR